MGDFYYVAGPGTRYGVGLGFELALAACQLAGIGLVIGDIDQAGAVNLEAVAEGQRRMVQILGPYPNVPGVEHAFDQIVIADRGAELLQGHREVGGLHLAGQGVAQGPRRLRGA